MRCSSAGHRAVLEPHALVGVPPSLVQAMRNPKVKSLAGLVILLSILVWAVALNQMNGWFSSRWFEYRVKKTLDPIELQQWATNLLAKHGSDFGGYEDFYG